MKNKSRLKIEDIILVAGAALAFAMGLDRIIANPSKGYYKYSGPTSVVETIEKPKPKFKLEEKIKQYQDPRTEDFSKDTDTMLLARLIYGESRGKSDELKIAVAYSVLNRVEKDSWYGKTLREVMLKRKQYSCFNPNDPNFVKVKDPYKFENPRVWKKCYNIAEKVLSKEVEDPTNGSTHYHTDTVKPNWRTKSIKKIDNTFFYNSVD